MAAAALAGWLSRSSGGSRTVPTFRQVTFRRANIATAAFTPDGKTIAYTVFNGKSHEVFLVSQGSRESRPLGVPGWVLSISASGEMALRQGDMLSVASIGGGAPRPLFEHVFWADWAPDGKGMALTRNIEGKSQLEYPAGHVIYSTANLLGRVKVSPGGDLLALIEGGNLVVFDSAGRRTQLAASVQESAWSPSGKEVFFTRIDRGVTDISAVSLSGRERLLASMPGDFTLFDISKDGRCLLERGGEKWDVFGRLAGEEHDRDLRWLDATVPGALSPDGKTLLFSEKDPAWQDATAYIRKMDGSPAVAIGPGFARSLSPDGKWALVLPSNPSPHLMLLPTGPGEPRILPNGDLEPFGIRVGGDFLPDGKQIVFSGQSKGAKPRIFVQDIAGGMPRPISGEGIRMNPRSRVSPDGSAVLALAGGSWGVYPISGGKGSAIPGMAEEDFLIGWTADSRAIYVAAKAEENPMRLVTLNVVSGERKLWKQIAHPATVNPASLFLIQMTPDGKSYVLSYSGWLSDLFLLEGLK